MSQPPTMPYCTVALKAGGVSLVAEMTPHYAFVAATLGLPQDWESFPEFGSEVA